MRFLRLLALSVLCAFGHAAAAEPAAPAMRFDSLGRFNVELNVPAGTRHAVLEISSDLSPATPWRKMIACATDGRAANVVFKLPRQGDRCFARVVTGTATTLPPVELADPELVTVTYGPVIGEGVKVDFLSDAGAKMREWKTLPRATYHQNLIDWALTHPFVTRASVAPVAGNVSILFADGDICVLLNKPRTSADGGTPQPLAAGIPVEKEEAGIGPKSVAIGSLPGRNRAVTAFSLESTFPNSAPTVAGWLAEKDYNATNYPSTTLSQIMSWSSSGSPLGVLFWHAHGCSYLRADNSEGIGIITREYADPDASHPVYSGMRESGELMLAIDDNEALPYYGITSKFIRNRMHFAPHSIVVLDACHGGHADLGSAFTAAGAGSFISWDWLSGDQSGTPLLKIFDRLLGTNQEPPISTPKERPFSLAAIRMWMTHNGYDYDPSPKYAAQNRPNARLVWHQHPTAPGHILLPTVMRVLAEAGDEGERFSKYLIEGDFGPDPGTSHRRVLWGGQQMQVVRWDALDGITIRIPEVPPRGEIQVVMSKDYYTYSNKVPITEWVVPFHYTVSSHGSLAATMEINVKFRGDIHGSRGAPEMAPQYNIVLFSNMADCTGTVSAAGTYQPNDSTTITWSGGSELRSVDGNTQPGAVLSKIIWSSGVLQVDLGKTMMFSLTANGTFTETERVALVDGGVRETVTEPVAALDSFPFLLTEGVSFNPVTGRLASGTRTLQGDPGSATLSWPAVTPFHAPTDQTPR